MPFYTFKCRTCKDDIEELRAIGDDSEPLCPRCAYNPEAQGKYERMKRVIGNVGGFQFKGDGFYETDYKRKKK